MVAYMDHKVGYQKISGFISQVDSNHATKTSQLLVAETCAYRTIPLSQDVDSVHKYLYAGM